MYSLPLEIDAGGQILAIRNKGDYRTIIDCITALNDDDLNDFEKSNAALYIFYDVDNVLAIKNWDAAIEEMMKFIAVSDDIGTDADVKCIDWEEDEKLVVAAVNKVRGEEIRALPYLHWWSFIASYMEIGESTLATIIGIRVKIKKGKSLDSWERDFRNNNPEYFMWKKDRDKQLKDKQLIDDIWERTDH